MKKIEAIIKQSKLEEVQSAVDEIGIEEMTVSEVKAFGRQKGHKETYRGTTFQVGFQPEIKIELVLQDNRLNAAVAAITKALETTAIGRGGVFVSEIHNAIANHVGALVELAA